jgi:hypothetical protein
VGTNVGVSVGEGDKGDWDIGCRIGEIAGGICGDLEGMMEGTLDDS